MRSLRSSGSYGMLGMCICFSRLRDKNSSGVSWRIIMNKSRRWNRQGERIVLVLSKRKDVLMKYDISRYMEPFIS